METLLDCGHPRGLHSGMSTGYGTDDKGRRSCYACCADQDRAYMIEHGRITLYLVRTARENLHSVSEVTNWPGSLRFLCFPALNVSKRGGGFGSQRTDAWFRGPDGFVWHAVNRGDNQIARCKRTKEKA